VTTSTHRGRWFALGAVAGAAAVALAMTVWTVAPVACATVGYEDTRPIQLDLPPGLSSSAEVSACFDLNCTPVVLEPDDAGNYSVPQEPPFLGRDETFPVSTTGVIVRVQDGGATVVDNRFGIGVISEAPFWSRCPGPFHHAPVIARG